MGRKSVSPYVAILCKALFDTVCSISIRHCQPLAAGVSPYFTMNYKVQWQYCWSRYWKTWKDMDDETATVLEEALEAKTTSCQIENRTHTIVFDLETFEQVSHDKYHYYSKCQTREIRHALIRPQAAAGAVREEDGFIMPQRW